MLDSTSVRRNVPVMDSHEEPGHNIREWLSLRAILSLSGFIWFFWFAFGNQYSLYILTNPAGLSTCKRDIMAVLIPMFYASLEATTPNTPLIIH